MLIHIGEGTLVRSDRIIGFLDLNGEGKNGGVAFQDFLSHKDKNEVELLTTDIPRAMVLTDEVPGGKVYITRLSSAALRHRCEAGEEMSERQKQD